MSSAVIIVNTAIVRETFFEDQSLTDVDAREFVGNVIAKLFFGVDDVTDTSSEGTSGRVDHNSNWHPKVHASKWYHQ